MINDLIRETGLIVSDERDAILSGNIFRRNDDEFIPGSAAAERDFYDAAARDPAPNRCSEQHFGQDHIVNVLGPAGYFVASLLTRNGVADDAITAHFVIPRIFWPADGIV